MNARETMLAYQEAQRRERNRKNYHTDEIRKFSGKIVATNTNWFFVLEIYKDNSAALRAVAKPATGCRSCQYCGTNKLRSHLRDMIKYKKTYKKTSIPNDWTIINPAFFAALNIA